MPVKKLQKRPLRTVDPKALTAVSGGGVRLTDILVSN